MERSFFLLSRGAAIAAAVALLLTACTLQPGPDAGWRPSGSWSVPPRTEPQKNQPPREPPAATAALEPDPSQWRGAGTDPGRLPAHEFQALMPFLEGEASWYGPAFHGKKTASGETYDQFAFTAAHRVLPMGTLVKVRHLGNRRTVLVRINDRGPYKKGRILDLSRSAARRLGMLGTGTAPVHITVLRWPAGADLSMGLKPYRQFVVQVAAYPGRPQAERHKARMEAELGEIPVLVDPTPAGPFAVVAGPFDEEYAARRVSLTLKRKGVTNLVRSYRK